jgi:hypothetical protein
MHHMSPGESCLVSAAASKLLSPSLSQATHLFIGALGGKQAQIHLLLLQGCCFPDGIVAALLGWVGPGLS